ncbi:MAG: 2-C-methyl-D-erythritol 4-phosphate cytidylyltransferase [Clostridia bacterium]|nr:2-C-methyl-D-erythritol 4-phosphate cytidylyltransferase [Clostridia bacterium]
MVGKTEFKLDYSTVDLERSAVPVIVVAAGSFSRMNGIHKQFSTICGIPTVIRSLMAFENSRFISRIVLVARKEDIPQMQLQTQKYNISKLTDITPGGNCRQESVMRGMERLEAKETKVLIHDGARPLVSESIISNTVLKLKCADAVVCAVKVNDTVKLCNDSNVVERTIDRSHLYLAQTPQGVDVAKYKEAYAKFNDLDLTDDASIMERAGYSVLITEGSVQNIKITTPYDLKLAEMFIEGDSE